MLPSTMYRYFMPLPENIGHIMVLAIPFQGVDKIWSFGRLATNRLISSELS